MTKMECRKIDYLILKEWPFQRVTAYIFRRLSAQPRGKKNGMDISTASIPLQGLLQILRKVENLSEPLASPIDY